MRPCPAINRPIENKAAIRQLPGDLSASSRYYAEDIANPPFVLNPDSTISVPTAPGLGVRANVKNLERFTVKREAFDA